MNSPNAEKPALLRRAIQVGLDDVAAGGVVRTAAAEIAKEPDDDDVADSEELVLVQRYSASAGSSSPAFCFGPLSRPFAAGSRPTSSITAMSAASPYRTPAFNTRV